MNLLKTVRSILLATLLSMVAAAALAVPASAQNVQATFNIKSVTSPSAPLKVDLDTFEISVKWVYSMPTQATPALGAVQTSTTLQWQWTPADCNKPGIVLLGSFTETIQ